MMQKMMLAASIKNDSASWTVTQQAHKFFKKLKLPLQKKLEMKSFKITTTKDLSELKEDVITLKKITSDKIENLSNISLFVHRKYPDVSTERIPISTFDSNILYTRAPEININQKIVNCSISTLEIMYPKDIQFQIFYETLADKLQQLKEKEEKTRSNVKNEVEKWQRSVANLFQDIILWIQPYKDNIKHDIVKFTISEEITGHYEMQMLTIRPSVGNSITFRPIGTFIIGAQGRIDINITAFGKSIMLLLSREEDKDKWVMIINRNINNNIMFEKSQFINLLDEVIPA